MKREDLAPALSLSLVVAFLLAPVLAGRAAFFYRDIPWLWYPSVESFARSLASGAWPLWDPHPSFGGPMLANPNYQVAYPLGWPSLLLPPRAGYTLFVAIHLLLGGLGVAAWLSRLGAGRTSGVVGGAVWILSGPLASFTSFHQQLPAVSLLPWALAFVESLLVAPTLPGAVPLAATLALQALSGSAEMPWATAIAVGVRVAAWAAAGRSLAAASLVLARLAAAAGLAAGLAAVQVLPALDLLARSSRVGAAPMPHQAWSLHPVSLADLLSRGFTTEAFLDASWQGRLFDGREPFLASLYLGAAAVPWALLGLRRRLAWLAPLMVAGLLLALGDHTPFYRWLGAVPPFTSLRFPVKFMALVTLAWAVATGLGFDVWRRDAARAPRTPGAAAVGLGLVAGVAALLVPGGLLPFARPGALWLTALTAGAAGALYLIGGRASPRFAPAAAAALMLLDCGLAAGHGLNLTAPAITAFRPDWIARLPPRTRLQARSPRAREDRLTEAPAGVSRSDWFTLGVLQQALPPMGARWGLDSAFDGDFFGLKPPLAHQVTQALFSDWGSPAALRLLQAGSIDYVVSTSDEAWLGPATVTSQSAWKEAVRLTRVPDPLPRALVVSGVRVLDDAGALRAVIAGEVDLRREVLLPAGAPRPIGAAPAGVARIESFRADRLTVSVAAQAPAWLVLAESYDPGWRAAIDGRPAVVSRANLLFRAVEVPAGRHVVELVYRPPTAWIGALLSAATLLGLVLAWREAGAAGRRIGR
ncbi:MAG: YfhO family protein [Vicinamibacteria bacterium]